MTNYEQFITLKWQFVEQQNTNMGDGSLGECSLALANDKILFICFI